jgi:GNAT superfamily N-acetyltransferase
MEIIEYDKKYKQEFIDLNLSWIKKFFKVEAHDLEQVEHVETYLKDEGMVYFAVEAGVVLSTVLVLREKGDTWEIAKFATSEKAQGKGAGKAVFARAKQHALAHGAKKIVIYSNQMLKPALHIYHSFGFIEVPVTIDEYERCDYQSEFLVSKN